MTYYVASSELEAFGFTGGVTQSTTAGYFDPLYCRSGIKINGGDTAGILVALLDNPISEAWIHFDVRPNSNVGSSSFFAAYNSEGQKIVDLQHTIAGSNPGPLVGRYAQDDGTMTNFYSSLGAISATLTTYDVHIVTNGVTTSLVELFIGGLKVGFFTGTASRLSNIARCEWASTTPLSDFATFSQIIIADTPTTGRKLAVRPIVGNGTHGDWTGDYTDINENGVNDLTVITANAADQISTFTVGQLTGLPTTLSVEAVIISLRAQTTALGPTGLRGVIRTGGLDFTSADFSHLSDAQGRFTAAWTLNPDTGVKWTFNEANAVDLEVGVKST